MARAYLADGRRQELTGTDVDVPLPALAAVWHLCFMSDPYLPTSDFLKVIIAQEVPLSGSASADANLLRLINMMRDEDRSNRDWATFLLAQANVDTTAVREALFRAAGDEDEFVRAEAISGLARRNRDLALPFVQNALLSELVAVPIFEAAALCADSSLVESLHIWAEPSDNAYADQIAAEALAACQRGTPLAS